ncbi:LysR family transcriptional regulator [Pseudomonas syringae]|uniref:LysR family transcriptional regulator n=4 Tax=Pseudomonas syringae TaxID=317 RepID=A0A656K4J2_PSESF|nr:LysR family transcriptional regulator [Pseudomonas syringae]EPN69255.1 LysR family transcriptional regulator [Pseudomonas syringae pv. actinidiae ICMP 19096]EPM43709.1 LysR family transcriptional regulator [Pseudomonas syringae pv. actinidiae ICMP 19098]EPN14736.1 LysR family transcriptional regulator [Pseudomonas syringae pv. actinidiae ICMP 19100]EPN23225.1 LysR family transcriptional regulator [Pseudomonas syringae pv. actinidiae ICMP 19099]EPN30724.1 LysR family transcriptional regulato
MPVLPTARLSRADLADLNSFLAVERMRSFTHAAVELGITTSALSHSIRNLESRLGVRLLNRTSRTVSPTDAGAALAKRLAVGFSEISGALTALDRHRDRPSGRLRLNVLSDGARLLFTKYLPAFLEAYPEVSVEVAVDDRMVDIVSAGFDAGIRFGNTIPEDFIAVRLSEELRWVAVASPRYLNANTRIVIPEDLKQHNCIQIRTGNGVIYRWDFEKDGDHRAIDVPGKLCVNETAFGIEMALADAGITYCLEERVKPHLARGELQVVLPDWAPIEPAFHIYYPGRRQMPPGLRELIDLFRAELAS